MTNAPQLAPFVAATAGAGVLMTIAGLEKRALEWKRRRRTCPSCRRRIQRRACGCSRR